MPLCATCLVATRGVRVVAPGPEARPAAEASRRAGEAARRSTAARRVPVGGGQAGPVGPLGGHLWPRQRDITHTSAGFTKREKCARFAAGP